MPRKKRDTPGPALPGNPSEALPVEQAGDLYLIIWIDGFGAPHTIQDPQSWSRSRGQALSLAREIQARGATSVQVLVDSKGERKPVAKFG